jgi:hypothetical protein
MITGLHRKARLAGVALPLLLLAGAAYAGHKVQREDRKTVNVTGQTTLVITNTRGKTIVVGHPDSRQVKIIASKWVKAANAESAERIMKDLDYEVEVLENDILIVSKLPGITKEDRSLWELVKRHGQIAWIDFTVEVPSRFDVHTNTTSGDVQLTNIAGLVNVNATSGDVLLRDIGGESEIEITSGDVEAGEIGGNLRIVASSGSAEVRRVKGTLAVQATSGNVYASEIGGNTLVSLITGSLDLTGCLGDVNFSTSRGNARIAGVIGGVNATTSSGKLDVVIVPVGDKEFYLNTASGDVVLHYAPAEDYGFLLDVNTCTGWIKGDLDIRTVSQISRHKLRGVVGNGKSKVIIETASGNVSIVELSKKSN